MPEIKPLAKIAKVWARRAAQASDEYKDGVLNPRRDWENSTKESRAVYESALQESFGRNAFVLGVEKAGTKKWQEKASTLGPGRYSEGVRAAVEEFEAVFKPFHARIAATDLPPRGPKGSPENIERVRIIAEALHNEKIGA